MSRRQIHFTPTSDDFDETLGKLQKHYGVKKRSVLISQAIIDFVRLKKL